MQLRYAIEDALRAPRPRDVVEAIDEFGSNAAMAEWLSGTTDRKDKAFRAAMRRAQRYRQGTRHPSPADREKILRGAGRLRTRRKRDRLRAVGSQVIITADIEISADRRTRTIHMQLSGYSWRLILNPWERGQRSVAADAFSERLAVENLGGQIPTFHDVVGLAVVPN